MIDNDLLLPDDASPDWIALNQTVIACRKCPRLVEWREQVAREKRKAFKDWDYWGRPVPGFGDLNGRVLLIALAPGAHGSNRTGRPFTGDSSGDTLYAALHRAGFANQPVARHKGDGLELTDAFITAIGRCAPPANKPTAQEIANCRPYLRREWELLPNVKVVVALGQMGFDGFLRMLRESGQAVPRLKFGHGAHYPLDLADRSIHLVSAYHPSRQNTQTGRLTPDMLDDVFNLARELANN